VYRHVGDDQRQERPVLLHPIQRRYLAEDLVRRRRADEHRRHVASQRAARIDPNPHQIDAVMFALARLPDGGCILADEVGLGKTIEAGLVIAQVLSEGATRVLVVTPKALLGQWKQELFTLFSIDGHEVTRADTTFIGNGVFLATRDLVGSEQGAEALKEAGRFDLCVVDEAHEVFAGIYRRFDRNGSDRDDSPHARMASRLARAVRGSGTPILLLTATPIQNSLLELWGLVHYIDPTGTLLGDLSTFQDLFCPIDVRVLAPGQEHELQRRLATVVKRTLRRQAQDFMREPFVGRHARTFWYSMSPEERALYDDITAYLLEDDLEAFRVNQRALLLLGFHRRMASSVRALTASLERVADRLRHPGKDVRADEVFLGDLDVDPAPAADVASPRDENRAAAELARVESFITRARTLPMDSKAQELLRAIRFVIDRAEHGRSSGKVVIFTEYLDTQDYLRDLLIDSRLVGESDITIFRGTNDSQRAMQALARWNQEVGRTIEGTLPSADVAVRLALVHEFHTRSRIFISTEAGAKGLNLQFSNTVINYDLPWNPQRIEQRIGRCHRYGQRRDVTVINFIASDNAAQQLTYEILSQKIDLFGTVLGASDEVLHQPGTTSPETLASAVGGDLEAQLRRIYERARTLDEIERELRSLRDSMDCKRREFEAAQQRTEEVIRSRMDASVRQVFARIQQELPADLAAFDRDVERVVMAYLDEIGASYRIVRGDGPPELVVDASPRLPDGLSGGVRCVLGPAPRGSLQTALHLAHPLVQAALDEIRTATADRAFRVRVTPASPELAAYRGQRGRLRLLRVTHRSYEKTDELIPVVVFTEDHRPMSLSLARRLLEEPMTDTASVSPDVSDEDLDDATDEILFDALGDLGSREQRRFEATLEQLERFLTDRVLLHERQRDAVVAHLARAEAARDGATGSEQRSRAEAQLRKAQEDLDHLDAAISRLRAGDDETYRRWRTQVQERRYAPPDVVRVLHAELEIA
jgi:hypothetical protein